MDHNQHLRSWHDYATLPAYSALRDSARRIVATMPDERQQELLKRLSATKGAFNILFELYVGGALLAMGFDPVYEPEIDGKTPDWLVAATESTPKFIVEVVTVHHSEEVGAELRQYVDLSKRLRAIPVGAKIKFRAVIRSQFNQKLNKHIAQQVRKWLQGQPKIGSSKQVDNVVIDLLDVSDRYDSLQVRGPGISPRVNPKALGDSISDKLKKYKVLAKKNELPIVVATTATLISALGPYELEISLYGAKVGPVFNLEDYPEEDYPELDSSPLPEPRGLFHQYPELSAVLWLEDADHAVLWLEDADQGNHRMRVLYNPVAQYPLEGAFALEAEEE